MFLTPSLLRSTLLPLLTEYPTKGPHTALVLLPHGQLLCSVSTTSVGWVEPYDEASDEEEDKEEEEYAEDDEPYVETPERNRLLCGLAADYWLEEGGEAKTLRTDCDLGKFVIFPFSIPLNPSPSFPQHTQSQHHTRKLGVNNQGYSNGAVDQVSNGSSKVETEHETLLVVMNGVKAVEWKGLEEAAKIFCKKFEQFQ